MPYSTQISEAFAEIAQGATERSADFFEDFYPENTAQIRVTRNAIAQFVRYIEHISFPFAAALQGPEQFYKAINDGKGAEPGSPGAKGSMYHAYNYGMNMVKLAFYPSLDSNASWFEMVMASTSTPITLFDGSTHFFKLKS